MADKRDWPAGECADCGGTMKVVRSNQRYCATCRLGRQAAAHSGRTAECQNCGWDFIDWSQASHRDKPHNVVCGYCMIERAPMGGRESVQAPCGWAEGGKFTCLSGAGAIGVWVYSAPFNICFPDLTDPERFAENRESIIRVHRQLRASRKSATVEGEQ